MERNACANGVFMENLIVDGAHGGHYSKYLRPSEPLYPCTAVDGRYKVASSATVATCSLGVGQEQRANCIMGAVLDFVYYYHSDVQAKQLCAAVGPALQDGCRRTTAKAVALF